MLGCGNVLQKAMRALSRHPLHGARSPIATTHRFRNQQVGDRMVSHTITPSDSLPKCPFPVPFILCSAGLEVLNLERTRFVPGSTIMIPLNWKLRFPVGSFLSPHALSRQVLKRRHNVSVGD